MHWRATDWQYAMQVGASSPLAGASAVASIMLASRGGAADEQPVATASIKAHPTQPRLIHRATVTPPAPGSTRTRIARLQGACRCAAPRAVRPAREFEAPATTYGALRADGYYLARLALTEFALLASNDWFLLPVQVPVASLCRVETLTVRDVFGGCTAIDPATTPAVGDRGRWSMFTTTDSTAPDAVAPFLVVLSPGLGALRQSGPALEDVRFLRDEMANLVWAVEHTTTDRVGDPVNRADVEPLVSLVESPPPAPPEGQPPLPLRYRIQTSVPRLRIPFVVVPEAPAQGAFVLVEATLDVASAAETPSPRGMDVLRPDRPALRGRRHEGQG